MVGCPLITPEAELRLRPFGKPVADQTSGLVPPATDRAPVYGWLTVPDGSDAVPMPNGFGLTVSVKDAVACCGAGVRTVLPDVLPTEGVTVESVAVMVMAPVPAPVGVPVMAPVEGFRLRPAGRLPAVTDHV